MSDGADLTLTHNLGANQNVPAPLLPDNPNIAELSDLQGKYTKHFSLFTSDSEDSPYPPLLARQKMPNQQ